MGPAADSPVSHQWPFRTAEAERGRGEITALNLLRRSCASVEFLWQLKALETHRLHPDEVTAPQPVSAKCLARLSVKPVHVAGYQSDAEEQITMQKCCALSPESRGRHTVASYSPATGSVFVPNGARGLKL